MSRRRDGQIGSVTRSVLVTTDKRTWTAWRLRQIV